MKESKGRRLSEVVKRVARRGKAEARRLHELARSPDVPWVSRILILLAFLYLICPIDLIPDFIPVVGFADDVVIVGGLLMLALLLMPRRKKEKIADTLARKAGDETATAHSDSRTARP